MFAKLNDFLDRLRLAWRAYTLSGYPLLPRLYWSMVYAHG
jgi:hypothetical protein